MKKFITIVAFLYLFSCKAQIIPLNNDHVDIPFGAYLNDTENELDKYVGTWQYQNGNESLTIVLDKFLHYNYGSYYKDILIGEYKYIDPTGTTIVNTLPTMIENMNPLAHNISGAHFKNKFEYPKCLDCDPNEFRIKCYFDDPLIKYVPTAIIFRWINSTQIKAKIYGDGNSFGPTDDSPSTVRVPYLEFTLNKI
jgi:hypothetical protein